MCYKRGMRNWMRDRFMRRRTKRGPNNSESTGKIGQEIPQDQPAPLQPSYPGPHPTSTAAEPSGASEQAQPTPRATSSSGPARERSRRSSAADNEAKRDEGKQSEGKLVVETQPESLAMPPAEMQAAQSPKGYVVLTIGLPGSGKTTWFKRRGVTPLSSDMLRNILFDDITEQRYQGLVFSTLRSLLRARLIAKMPWNYVDATNLSPHERRQWIKMARSFGFEVQAVFFDVPIEVCLERNQRRERTVNEETIRKMAERLRPPNFKEGFSKITVVRVKSASSDPAKDHHG